uniref:Short myomegalin-like EB1 binding protein N-terminal domain-containing protein n=1 Tax=Fundulus heteroclitus TaxID=8078 RepID=A0A3Q2NS11_FUNHE
MKEACRICGRELCGNQRRWIFHPASKLNLQVLLSHALGQELTRDGRGEFACSKCTFMLDRMYRFDTVIARVEALSIERLQRLLQEKYRLKQCIGGLYWRTNPEEGAVPFTGAGERSRDGIVDISGLTHAKYCALLQDDLVYSLYESWADDGPDCQHQHHQPCSEAPGAGSHHCHPSAPRRCRGCSYWRVADSDYEAVCKVPRKLARSTSCGPSTRYSASVIGGSVAGGGGGEAERKNFDDSEEAPNGSLTSPGETMEDHFSDSLSEEHMGAPLSSPGPGLSLALCLLQSYAAYRPVRHRRGSKLPVLTQRSFRNGATRLRFPDPLLGVLDLEENHNLNFADMEDLLEDLYREYPPPPPHQVLESLQSQLNQYECAAGQCVSELQKAQLQVQSLQAKIQESEANNMLQEKLNEMECELRSLRQAAQGQERTIQGLTESVTTKDSEVCAQELYHLIEGQNNTLCKLQELAHRNQLAQSQVIPSLQGELVRAQSSLFSLGLELDASQRSLRQSQRQGDDLLKFKDRLNADLQEALQHREVTEKHNQDLRGALQKTRSELQAKEAALKESEEERAAAALKKDRIIAQLQRSLQEKEQQLQEYAEMLESTKSSKPRDVQLEKLRERIKERDRALERSIDDKFSCLEEREGQVRALQLALREKERDLERLRCILSNNEETITSLDALVRNKELELEQAAEAYRNLQWLKQKSEEKEKTALKEKDAIIRQLQAALQAFADELKARLALKEKLFQELLSDRSRQTDEHQAQVQDLLNTLSSKDQYLQVCSGDMKNDGRAEHKKKRALHICSLYQDYSYRLSLVISERTNEQQELRKQLTQTEQELRRSKERETGGETEHLRSLLKEKEAFIKVCILLTRPLTSSPGLPGFTVRFVSGADPGAGGGCAGGERG